ncbi:MAG: 23S rRNA (guanosine(2251)-2'-O)-methyltransferase RlmB [Gammaproteobacteria bacterium]
MTEHTNTVYGLHAVLAALSQPENNVTELWLDGSRHDERIKKIVTTAEQAKVALHKVTRHELDVMAPGARHQGVLAHCKSSPSYTESDLLPLLAALDEPVFLLVLDGVQDPHNLGACLRSAEAAGVHGVIVPRDRAASLTPTVRKVASGAAEVLPVFQVTNLARTLRIIKEQGVWLIGAAGDAEASLYQTDLRGPLAVVMGGEGGGLRRLTRNLCDHLLHIPMAGTVESLNVSVATGICLFEAVRQRGGG